MSVGLLIRICQRWVYRYNELRLAELNDQRGTPRPSLPIPPELGPQLRERLAAGPLLEDQVATLSDAIFTSCLSASKSTPFPDQPVERGADTRVPQPAKFDWNRTYEC